MARKRKTIKPFAYDLDAADIQRERHRAREIRESQWWKRQCAKGRCYYCDHEVAAGKLTMDHIVPLARGGRSTKGNLVPCCKACNTAKKQLMPMEWEEYLQKIRTQRQDKSHI